MLELINVNTYYGQTHILRDLSLHINKGETISILGRNGAGKTTTIHTIMGFVPSRDGKIILNNTDITGKASYLIAKLGVGLVPQGRRVFRSLSVRENLLLGARNKASYNDGPKKWDIKRVYNCFPRLKERENIKADQLSGGEQQMLALGRALMTNPNILLLDEPSAGLSPLMVKEIGRIIKEIKQEMAILLVEQNLQFALSIADRIYVFNKGTIVFEAVPEALPNDERINKYLGI